MSVRNVFTTEAYSIPVDTRTVAYVRIAVFVALAFSFPLPMTARGLRAVALGSALLAATISLSVLLPLFQVLGMVRVVELGVLAQSMISVGIMTLVTYPSMAYGIPGLLWWLTLRLADPPAEVVAPTHTHDATTGAERPTPKAGGS